MGSVGEFCYLLDSERAERLSLQFRLERQNDRVNCCQYVSLRFTEGSSSDTFDVGSYAKSTTSQGPRVNH
jgi:hypothetical protein